MKAIWANLYKQMHPLHATLCEDGSNAFNEAELESIVEGILTAPEPIHGCLPYFFAQNAEPSVVFYDGHPEPLHFRRNGTQQGCPNGPCHFAYSIVHLTRTMTAELAQHPTVFERITLPRTRVPRRMQKQLTG